MKHQCRSFISVFASVSLLLPSFVQAAPIRYVEVADMDAATVTLQGACKDKELYTSPWYTCVYEFTQIGQTNVVGHGRVTVKDKTGVFSLELPQNSAWSMGEKPVRPYAVVPSTDKEFSGYRFGPVQILCSGMVDDGGCRVDRPYLLSVAKGTLKETKTKLARDIKNAKENSAFYGEELPIIEYMANGNKIALVPVVYSRSGSTSMYYASLLVERKGRIFSFSPTSFNASNHVDLELWRAAASIR